MSTLQVLLNRFAMRKLASAWKAQLAKKSIGKIFDLLGKTKNYRLPNKGTVEHAVSNDPVLAKSSLLEYVRGAGRAQDPLTIPLKDRLALYKQRPYSGTPTPVTMRDVKKLMTVPGHMQGNSANFLEAGERAFDKYMNVAVPKIKPIGPQISPLSLPDDATKYVWRGRTPNHLSEIFDDAGRAAKREINGKILDEPVWWGAAPEIGANFGTADGFGKPGVLLGKKTDQLRSYRLPGHSAVDTITKHEANNASRLNGPIKTPRELQFETVAVNDPIVPDEIYRVWPDARKGDVIRHPGSRDRRILFDKFRKEHGAAQAKQFGVDSPHLIQKMDFVEPVENTQRNKANFIKSLGDLTM